MPDLFGHPDPAPVMVSAFTGKVRRKTVPKGYAARPGTGPKGETCGSCEHRARVHHHNRHYNKCMLVRASWTHGPGTDILCRTPACRHWEKDTNP
jgi:hypothetical protein